MSGDRSGSSYRDFIVRRHLVPGIVVRCVVVVVSAALLALLTGAGAAADHAGGSAKSTDLHGPLTERSVRRPPRKVSLPPPGGISHVSVNADGARVNVPGDGVLHELVETPCPKLVPGDSAGGPVSNRNASSMIARVQFQIQSVRPVAPSFAFAQINFRRKSDDRIVSNLGFWGIGDSLLGAVSYLQAFSFDWLYVPYNNIPTPPINVGDCSAYNISLDIELNKGAGGVTVTNSMIELFAGDFYSPGTTQIGNSPPPGPVGSP